MDINKLQDFVNKVQTGEQKWLSRKLLVTVALIGGLIWMASGNIPLILWQITILAGLWLLCTTYIDGKTIDCKQRTKDKLIDVMSKDGIITPEEADIIQKV